MGYMTDFTGNLKLSENKYTELLEYINLFSSTRRVKRNVEMLYKKYNGEHGLNGNYGNEGEFFAKDDGMMGQSHTDDIIDSNAPPNNQPGLWAQWIIETYPDGQYLEWDGGEKFYNYIEWLQYYIDNFFEPNNIKLNGEIKWEGEDSDDLGKIIVTDNIVEVKEGKIVYE